jgi:hypothetical protein
MHHKHVPDMAHATRKAHVNAMQDGRVPTVRRRNPVSVCDPLVFSIGFRIEDFSKRRVFPLSLMFLSRASSCGSA